MANDAHDAVVGAGTSGGRIYEDVYRLVEDRGRGRKVVDHALDILFSGDKVFV